MGKHIDKLVGIASDALSKQRPALSSDAFSNVQAAPKSLLSLLSKKNGLYAFESALHVFPSEPVGAEIGLVQWNQRELWIGQYEGMADSCVFFAEDIFGGQFCIRDDGIYTFDPETAAFDYIASDLEAWAGAVLADYNVLTGYPLAQAWQRENGPLPIGMRLIPKTPFVAGGAFELENLYALDSVKAMQFRATLATQIRDLPDGATIRWNVVD